jgi:hypothetical protein
MNDQTPDPLDQDILDVTLSESLQTRWPARALPERQVKTILTHIETQNRKFTMQTRLSNFLRPVAFVGGLAILVLALSWLLGSMRPNPAVEIPATPTPLNTPVPESTLPVETPAPTDAVEPTSTPLPAEGPSSGFLTMPSVTFAFANPLPTSPAQIPVYLQAPQGDELNEDSVRAMAEQMGLNGEITPYEGEMGGMHYIVTDGSLQMIFYGYADQFSYFPSIPTLPNPDMNEMYYRGMYAPPTTSLADPLPFDQRVALAEDFLNAHSLLDYPYRAEPSETDPNGVRFIELLDGIPLVYGVGKNPGMIERINISIDPDGQISSLFHSHHHYQPLDAYPLLTAEQAWARLAAENANRARYAVLAPAQSWTRAGLIPAEKITGYLSNENGDTTFYADDGRFFPLLDIPADMPLYPVLAIKGTVTDAGLDWSEITLTDYGYGSMMSCGGGGGGGGGGGDIPVANFGGGFFATVALADDRVPLPTDLVNPLKLGDSMDGVQGTFTVYRILHADGTATMQYNFWYPGDETHPRWFGQITGETLTGIEPLQNLPIKIWGTVSTINENNVPILTVDRYEEVYPGASIQAWQGTEQIVTLEGQEVIVFTSQDGEQFVDYHSIDQEDFLFGQAGMAILLEGYLIPDQTFAGYPVINKIMGGPLDEQTTLENYPLQSNQIIDLEYSPDPAQFLTGHVTIENVELMYAAATLTQCNPLVSNDPAYAYTLVAQPVWRFTGHFDDGRIFEVQIQALPDEYLR